MLIDLHPNQSGIYEDIFVKQKHRYEILCCSRGFGKSYLGATTVATAVDELLQLARRVPNKVVWVIAPTYDQVIDIYYPLLAVDMGLDDLAIKSSKDTGKFLFDKNVEIRLLSYEAIERMRGKGAYFVLWDEISSCKKGIKPLAAWESIIQPCITTRWSVEAAKRFGAVSPGRMLGISTPDGYNDFHSLYSMAEADPSTWGSHHYSYLDSPLLDHAEIEKLKATMDAVKFASEYAALFKESGLSVFYCFDRKVNVRADLEDFNADEDVHIGIDFNVGLQCSSAFAVRGGQMHYLHELKGHPDTEQLAKTIRAKWPLKKIYAYPDPTGKSRKTSAPVGRNDFTILQSYNIEVLAPKASPGIIDTVNAVNRMLRNGKDASNMFFHPRCKGTIESVERTRWVESNPDLAVIDKSDGVEHFSDNVRYATNVLFPIKSDGKPVYRNPNRLI